MLPTVPGQRCSQVVDLQVLEFRIFGPVEVVDETGPLTLGGQRQRAVLALLLLNIGSVVPTNHIIDEVWGEQPPKAVRTALQNVVGQLRRLIGAETLVRKAPGYVLQVEPDQLDLSRFSSDWSRRRETRVPSSGRGRCARRSRFGGARRSPTLPSRRSHWARRGGSRSFGWKLSRRGSTPTSS